MKAIKLKPKNPNDISHVMFGLYKTLCGKLISENAEFTRKKVDCAECIRAIKLCKNVKPEQYVH